MKKIFLLFAIVITSVSITANAGTSNPLKEKDLKYQISNEIREKLSSPVYISYINKDLSGKVTCKMNVNENGKISISDVQSKNKNLNTYITKKINSLNLWTGLEYSGKSYSYTINFK